MMHNSPSARLLAAKLKKSDTVALWHAVQAQGDMVQAMKGMNFTPEQVEVEQAKLSASKAALRKVNAIRRNNAGLPSLTGRGV